VEKDEVEEKEPYLKERKLQVDADQGAK